nr:glycerophosphodiester phosphodiesterase family protein [uncultured Draconibacterium sp.]
MKTLTLLVLLFMGLNSIAQNTFIAHRGASYLAPENTVASANLAWKLGADAVEVDVHLSKDNRVIVIHDKDTKRTCAGKTNLTIAKTPSILLRDLDAGSWKGEEFKGEKLPFLSEIIETVPEGKTLVVEIKAGGDEIIPALSRIVDNSGKKEQIVFISFGWKTIIATHEEFPENKCYWLSSLKPGLKKKIEEAATEGLTGINLKHSIIDEEIMAQAKDLNLEVLSWTIDDTEEAQRLTDIGVTGITTNRPKWLKEQMNQ